MSKPTGYIDANICSALHYRGGDPLVLKEQLATREWWQSERGFYRLLASKAVEDELAAGEYDNQAEALAEARRLPFLPLVAAVRETTARLLAAHIVPETSRIDALHLAFATVYGVDYLLTWNRAHLVNAQTQGKLARFREVSGLRTPLIVSPLTIPKAALGEEIRRRD